MQKTKSRDRLAVDAQQLSAVEGLLLKYPRVRPDEIDSIARFLRHGPTIDIGLLSANREAWEKADDFRRDHAARFATTPREYAVIAVIMAAFALGLVSLWHAAAGS